MEITIIIKAFHRNTVISTLKYLSKQSIHDDLEIIIINECYDDIVEIINLFDNEFDNIIIKNTDNSKTYNQILIEAKGEYLLFTTSNDLSAEDAYKDSRFLEKLYKKISRNSCDMILFNKLNYHEYKKLPYNYDFIDSIVGKTFKYEDISKDELITLSTLDCDVLYSNNYKVNPSRFTDKCLKNPDEFVLKNIVNDNNILILKNYSTHRKFFEPLLPLEDDNQIQKSDRALNKSYKDDLKLDINKTNDVQKIINKGFNPKISIITPVNNPLPNDIIRNVNSLFYQKFGFNNLEMIFVNDASTFTDGIDLIKKFSDTYPNIHFFELEEYSGLGSSCNVGLEHATGKYVMFSNQQNYYTENACKILYNVITTHNVDIVCGNYVCDRIPGMSSNWNDYGLTDHQKTLDTVDSKKVAFSLPSSISSKIYKNRFLKKNNIRMTDFNIDSYTIFDYETLLKDSKLLYINEDITIYEQEENPLKPKPEDFYSFENLLEVYETRYYLYDLCEKNNPDVTFTVLNTMNYVTNRILFKTPLSFDEFKEVVDYSDKLYSEYLNNPDVYKENDVEEIATCIDSRDYDGANKIYKRFEKEPTHSYSR